MDILEIDIRKAIDNSHSMSEAAKLLKVNYKTFKKYAKRYNLFKPNRGRKGVKFTRVPTEDYLNNLRPISSTTLKNRLLEDRLIENRCYGIRCTITNEWLGKSISLDLDHIDGDGNNNNLNNIRLLCPNCHSQTPTYKGKNRGRKLTFEDCDLQKVVEESFNISQVCVRLGLTPKGGNYSTIRKRMKKMGLSFDEIDYSSLNEDYYKCACGNDKSKRAKTCMNCRSKSQRRVDRPSHDQLVIDIKELGFIGTGRKYGVSDNAIRKWM